jgi:uncharacterized glyoxalase superfamily protein PhnB
LDEKPLGFTVRIKIVGDDGTIHHAELELGDGLIMIGQAKDHRSRDWHRSPKSVGGGNTQALFAYVDDADAHCTRAREAGATIVTEPTTNDYGPEFWTDRSYEAVDPEGHHWWFGQRLRTAGE